MRRFIGLSGAYAIAAMVAVVWAAACGGGTGGGPAPRSPQFVLDPVGSASNAGSFIMGIERNSIDANNADRVVVTARVLDPDNRPIRGIEVVFRASFQDVTFLGGGAGLLDDFPNATAITDATGTAMVTLMAGATPGRLSVAGFTRNRNMGLGGVIFLNLTDVGFISGDLQVIPAEIDLTDPKPGTVLEFLVTGGQPFVPPAAPYILENPTSGIGTAELLDDGSFPVVIRYTVTGKQGGAHVFTVVDAKGIAVTGTVMVELSTLEIVPETASLMTGQMQNFAVTGGVPPYTCSANGGTLSKTTLTERGEVTVFTAGEVLSSTTYTMLCTDVAGQIASATITVTPIPTPAPTGSGGGPTPAPTPTGQTVTTIVVQPNPSSVNGVEGGTSDIVATVLDQNNFGIAGVNVLFTIGGQSGDPGPTAPSVQPLTAASSGGGEAVSVLTVPAGTPPQFLQVTAQAQGKSGTGQVGVTSQNVNPPGPPARLNAALFKVNGYGDNNDGTYVTVFSALVTDANGNPVANGVEVDWGPITPNTATVSSPTFTNGAPPCNIEPYESNTGLAVVPQPGTALTCVIYPASLAFLSGAVTVTVPGTSLTRTASFILPGPFIPTPTPAPPPTPAPTPTPTPVPTPTPTPVPTPTP